MARQGTQVLELDLRSGIETDDSPLAIGPKLLSSGECAWQPYGLTDELRRRVLAFLPHRDLADTLATATPFGAILTVLALDPNGDFPSGGLLVLANPTPGLGQCTMQQMDGTQFAVSETLGTLVASYRSGWSVVWTGIATTTVYFGHPAFGLVYQVVAPGTAGPVPYQPTVSPITTTNPLTPDATLDLQFLAAVAVLAGETALPNATWKLQLTGIDATGMEVAMSDESAGVSTAGKALQFTVPDVSGTYQRTNLYAKQGSDPFILQQADILPGLYHLSGNGKADPAAPALKSFKFLSVAPQQVDLTLPLDPALDPPLTLGPRTPPEKQLANGTYFVTLQATQIATGVAVRSEAKAPGAFPGMASANQVLAFTTPAGYTDLFLFARKDSGAISYLQHPTMGGHGHITPVALAASTTYHLNGSGGVVQPHAGFFGVAYAATGPPPGGAMPNIVDAIVHLDRLALLQAPGKGRSTLYYTNPIDPTTILPDNFVVIPADATCVFRCNVGAIDPGAASHLLFGCKTSIWVLDGDPATNSAVLRRLTFDCGIADRSCVVETSFGAVFLGTDGQFYLIPPGATQVLPIGHRALTFAFEAVFQTPRASLAWLSPYVVYCANDPALYFADLSPLAAQGAPRWWGPVTPGALDPATDLLLTGTSDLVRVSGTTPEAAPDLANAIFFVSLVDGLAQLDVITLGTTGTLTGRTASVASGFLSVEDHKVELRRVVLETTSPATDLVVTVQASDTKGSGVVVQRTMKGVGLTARNILSKTVFDFSSTPVVGDAFQLVVTWPDATPPDLHRAYAEVRTQPKQD